ncbi:MAG: hypothetical protein ACE5HX_19390 [bacterium]
MYMLGILTGMVICFAVDYLLDWIEDNIMMREGGDDDDDYYKMAEKTLDKRG